VISTPVSIVSAISAGARAGVLFKGGAALEAAGRRGALAFDKTGTLTVGQPVVTTVMVFDGPRTEKREPRTGGNIALIAETESTSACCDHCDTHSHAAEPLQPLSAAAEELLQLAAAVERRSAHPLARAIVEAAQAHALPIPQASDFQAHNGRGASATVEGRRLSIGSRAMFQDAPLPDAIEAQLDELERAGSTVMLIGEEGAPLGAIACADEARAESAGTVAAVRDQGIAHVAMLTGDTPAVAERVAAQVGVDETRAGLLPDQKLAAIDELLDRYGSVAMVGDGVNDAPALARATVGVAMGAGGSDTALETADITLMADDLSRLPFAIGLSRATRRVILQNVSFALVVKALFLLATLFGVATLWMAVLADTGAALLVIANGMRLLRFRAPA
jgi:Cd2+/Zn2+-exporting ATPase